LDPRRKEALTHVGGAVTLQASDSELGAALVRALEVTSARDEVLRHVHGFHSYPARMHPDTAGTLVRELSDSGSTVLDPFCGSGTVLVEARLAGRRALGVDANPLAIELSWLKSGGLSPRSEAGLLDLCERAAEHAEARRQAKAGPTRRYGRLDRDLFDPHVLLELDGLRAGIERERAPKSLRRAAWLVLSSLLTKVSRRPGDTARRSTNRRLASGFTIHLFVARARQLAQQLGEFGSLLPDSALPARVRVGDARELAGIRPGSVDLVASSPPYPGIYDYTTQHATRLRWLELDATQFLRRELGARRRLQRLSPPEALQRWSRELGDALGAMRRVLRPSGRAALVMADSVLGGRAAYADDLLPELASRVGFSVVGRACQRRPHFHGPTSGAFRRRPRQEHLFVLGR